MRSHERNWQDEFAAIRRASGPTKRTCDLDEKAATAGINGVKISARFHVLAIGNASRAVQARLHAPKQPHSGNRTRQPGDTSKVGELAIDGPCGGRDAWLNT